ncbi:MAG: CHAD domain-containing protein [Hyphomicrobiaceae bacterium]
MAFRLKLSEPMDVGIRRIAAEQVDRAIVHIEATLGSEAAAAVHEARKCLKRTRALLRFGRPLIEPDAYKHASSVLRDVGRAMSGTRDLDVLEKLLSDLRLAGALKPATLARLARELATARKSAFADQIAAEARAGMVVQLKALRDGLPDLPIEVDDHRLVTDGIAECLADCRKAFGRAFGSDDGEAFHEWRKSVQLHWRQMQLVERAWPAYCHARIVEARAISMLIGTDRDLGLLLAFVTAHPVPKTMQGEVARLVARRQALLRLEAKAMGGRLLAEGTGGLCRRLEQYWAAARALRKAKRQDAAADVAIGPIKQADHSGT